MAPVARAASAEESIPRSTSTSTAIDSKYDPCVDFYRSTPATPWDTKNPIPADRGEYSTSSKLQLRINQSLKDLLTAAAEDKPTRTPAQREVGDLYAACMDEPALETKSLPALKLSLNHIDAMKSVDELPKLVAELHKDGESVLFGFGAQPDLNDASMIILAISQGGLGLPDRDYYLKTDAATVKIRDAYKAYITKMLSLTGTPAAQQKKMVAQIAEAWRRRWRRRRWTWSRCAIRRSSTTPCRSPSCRS